MRRINILPFNLLIAILMVLFSSSTSAQETPPNIILIITDQHAGRILSQAGYPYLETPGIDKIAAQGVTFTRSYCTNPVCTSSRKSFMTGKMPSQVGDLTAHASIGGSLLNAGYETAYFGKWHVGSTHMDELENWHGFETYTDARDDSDIAGWSTDFIKKEHSKPFFMITSFLNPHDCCELARNISGLDDNYHDGPVPEDMDTAYCPPLPSNFAIPENEAEGFYGRRNQDPDDNYYRSHPTKLWSEVEWRQYMYGYDRLVEKVDAHIETMYDELAQQGMLENTVIIYTSDHGDGHASHQWNQKKTFYEEAVGVPLILSWKGHTMEGMIDQETLTSNGLDLFPTILGFAGQSIPKSVHGNNLQEEVLTDFNGTGNTQRDYVVAEINQKIYTGFTPGTFNGRMLVTGDLKYILFDRGVNREQLFDLEKDPGELEPVTDQPEYNDALELCRTKLKEWCTLTGDDFSVDDIISDYEANPLLDAILINDQPIENFSPEIYNYTFDTITESQVVISVKPVNSGSTVIIDPFDDILGDSASRSASILVISEDGLNAGKYFLQVEGWEYYTHVTEEKYQPFRFLLDPGTQTLQPDQPGTDIKTLQIYSVTGQQLLSETLHARNPVVDVSHFAPGIYLLKALTSQGIIGHSFFKPY